MRCSAGLVRPLTLRSHRERTRLAAPGTARRDEVVLQPEGRPLSVEVARQDAKHGPFAGSTLGRSRLALACLDDEVREATQAWRDERRAPEWDAARTEVLQVAAVAVRALRDVFCRSNRTAEVFDERGELVEFVLPSTGAMWSWDVFSAEHLDATVEVLDRAGIRWKVVRR